MLHAQLLTSQLSGVHLRHYASSRGHPAARTDQAGRTHMSLNDVAVFLLAVGVGLTFAAHGAQKAFGWWGGPGVAGWQGALTHMGFRPVALFAFVSIAAELVG